MSHLSRLFKALADPNRLRIVNILSENALCVCDLQSVLNLSQPFVSRHLAYLRNLGVVRDRRDGPRVCYSLALEGQLGLALRSFLGEALPLSPNLRADLDRLDELAKAGSLKSRAFEPDWDELSSRAA